MGDASATASGGSGEAAAAAAAVAAVAVAVAVAEDQEVLLVHEDQNGGGVVLSANNSADQEDRKGSENILDESGGGGGGGSGSGGDRNVNFSGNRWPRQETLALLQIRSDMDSTFRNSSLKGPLWEEISRKLAELGFKRSAKKCKEKFENVYKYHKRTKDSRRAIAGKSDAKTYRFFDQLEAFHHQNHHPPPPPPPKPQPNIISTTAPPTPPSSNPPISSNTTILSHNLIYATSNPTLLTTTVISPTTNNIQEAKVSDLPQNHHTNHSTTHQPALVFSSPASSSSSTASDEEFQARHKRKRKWKDFFRRLTRQVVRKQEEMQKRFLETLVKCEGERAAREEAWRAQEMSRIGREHEMLVQERSAAAAKDAAVIAFLQKVSAGVSDQDHSAKIPTITTTVPSNANQFFSIHKTNVNNPNPVSLPPSSRPPPLQTSTILETDAAVAVSATPPTILATRQGNFVNSSSTTVSSSRWPKTEVEALINLRTTLELKYQENAPKGPLWEEISTGMRQLGYNRSAKRCKEKWENINKYFKKVKDNNKKRSEDSKTCPYFHTLDALYREKTKNSSSTSTDHGHHQHLGGVVGGPEKVAPLRFGTEPLMVQPERQWPLHQENNWNIPMNSEEEEEELEGDEDRDSSSTEVEEHRHEEGTGNGESYEIVANKHSSMDMVE